MSLVHIGDKYASILNGQRQEVVTYNTQNTEAPYSHKQVC